VIKACDSKWSTPQLIEVCEIIQGGRHKLSGKHFVEEGGYPAYGAGGHNGNLETFEFEKPGIVLSAIGARCGKCFKVSGRWSSLANTSVFFPDENKADVHFLWYQLNDENSWHRSGTAQPYIKPSDIKGRRIILPPLEEQKRIAGILDAADILRAKRREALAKLDDLLQSTFLDLFGDPVTNPKGWEEGLIGDLLESATYGTSKKADPNLGAYPVLRMNNITYSGEWNFTDLKYIDLEEKDLPKHLVHKGQILFNRTNSKELVGKTAAFRENEPMAFAGYLVRAIMNDRNDPEYLGAFMNTPQIKKYLQNKCNNIVGMANINAKKFQKIPIPIPPLDLQQRFAEIVSAVEEQKVKMRKHLEQLDDLFASLQQRAFRGDL
jgi:type I restriction enzyme, S subunit